MSGSPICWATSALVCGYVGLRRRSVSGSLIGWALVSGSLICWATSAQCVWQSDRLSTFVWQSGTCVWQSDMLGYVGTCVWQSDMLGYVGTVCLAV